MFKVVFNCVFVVGMLVLLLFVTSCSMRVGWGCGNVIVSGLFERICHDESVWNAPKEE